MIKGSLKTDNDLQTALKATLKAMAVNDKTDCVLAPAKTPSGGWAPTLFADLETMEAILPWSPTMPVQTARASSKVGLTDPGVRVTTVLRPCEARAAVELIKLKQINPDPFVFVTVDCPGSMEAIKLRESGTEGEAVAARLVENMTKGEFGGQGFKLRESCANCVAPFAEWGDVQVHGYGANGTAGLVCTEKGKAALEGIDAISFGDYPENGRDNIVEAVISSQAKRREETFAAFGEKSTGLKGLLATFADCIKCGNCMENCPICHCKTCIFKTTVLEHPGERVARWAERKGAQRLPVETTLFHLTRLNHMASSCVACGMCDTVCPMGLPVSTLFSRTGAEVQRVLDYAPGKSVDDPLPLSVFREAELEDISGAGE